jgi:ABC-type molybdate transport system substrate-binding protein
MLREAPLSRVSAAAAIATRARQPAAARQLIDFLAPRDAAEIVAATGLDPIRR